MAWISTKASSAAPARPAAVWLVRYDPNVVQVPVKRGENSGKTLPHKNVVQELTRLGDWSGGARTYAIPAASPGLTHPNRIWPILSSESRVAYSAIPPAQGKLYPQISQLTVPLEMLDTAPSPSVEEALKCSTRS